MKKGIIAYRSLIKKIPKGVDRAWHRAAGAIIRSNCRPATFLRHAEKVLEMHGQFSGLSETELKNQCHELRIIFRRGRETFNDMLRALAVLREVSRRVRGEHPYREQIAGVMAILSGCVAEMATGEGKTLCAALAAVIEGWRGRGCHLVTANDYLVRRDAEEMEAFYTYCGVRVRFITEQSSDSDRKDAYRADITYATNKTLAADFLKDQLSRQTNNIWSTDYWLPVEDGQNTGTGSTLMTGLHCVLVDEADSILIDEAVTPLILSGLSGNVEQEGDYHTAMELADRLMAEIDFRIVERKRGIELTESGRYKLQQWGSSVGGIFTSLRRTEELVSQSLVALFFYHRNKQYVLHENKVVIVDEFTGRLMPDREWRDGLHQAVAAREGAEVSQRKETLGRVSFQHLFRMYTKLSGMTGTAWEARQEIWDIYSLPVVQIPTHRPCIRKYFPVNIVGSLEEKHREILKIIKSSIHDGRSVLIGTRSVKTSQDLSHYLLENQIGHNLLNAEFHEIEADIIKEAGQSERITVATNMAGRGTDIKICKDVKNAGGLVVILTERHESRRIDRQLFGRCARQGDPGTVFEIISLDDELVTQTLGWLMKLIQKKTVLIPSSFRYALLPFFSLAQSLTERRARLIRYDLVEKNEALENALGFAGREYVT